MCTFRITSARALPEREDLQITKSAHLKTRSYIFDHDTNTNIMIVTIW